jgi:hypothetical protein
MNQRVHQQTEKIANDMNKLPLPKMVKFLKEQPITPQTVLHSHELRLNDLEDELEKKNNNSHLVSYNELSERNNHLEKMLIEQDDKLNEIKDMVLKLQAFMIETNMMVTEAKKQEEIAAEVRMKEAQAEGLRQLAEKGNINETEIKLSEEELFKKMMNGEKKNSLFSMFSGDNENLLATLLEGVSNNSTIESDIDYSEEEVDDDYKLNLNSSEDIKLEVSDIIDGTNSLEKLINQTFKSEITKEADLKKSHLEGGHVEEARIEEPHVEEAHIEEAHIEEAHIEEAHIEEARVEEARVEEAHIEEARVEEAHVEEAHVEEHTQKNKMGGRGKGRGKGGRGRGKGNK